MTDKDDDQQQTPEAALEEVRRSIELYAKNFAGQMLTALISGLVVGLDKCGKEIKAERKRGDELEKRLATLEARLNQ